MAIRLADQYENIEAANAAYPGGSFKNATGGLEDDGTPFEKAWSNDWLGFFQAILAQSGTVPSGAPDTAEVSQYLNGLRNLMWSPGDSKFVFYSEPKAGWLEMDGKTIGDATSGATGRANADTQALFTELWELPALQLYSSAGAAVARGANAAADFAAHRRIPVPDMRGMAARGWDHGRGVDAGRALGSYQADMVGPHTHPATTPAALADSNSGGDTHNYGALGASGQNVGTETRMKNIAGMWVIKL